MKKDSTELVFILDRSGSMHGMEADTIGGFNSMLKKQKEEPGECRITTVLFDDRYELLHDRLDLQAVAELTDKDYTVRGCTALIDAIGKTIKKIGDAQKHTAEEYRASKVLFVIITDGYENASRRYSSAEVKAMIERQKEKYGWEFIFLGANIDAVETARHFGIAEDRAVNFHNDHVGVHLNYSVMADVAADFRHTGKVCACRMASIREDFVKRGGRK